MRFLCMPRGAPAAFVRAKSSTTVGADASCWCTPCSFSLDERTVAALLQEDESTFNLLGGLLPSAASAAALAAADAQHGEPNGLSAANAAAMQHLLQNYASQVRRGLAGPPAVQ